MSGVMGGQISTTSWGWHEIDQLRGDGPKWERIWSVTDSRGVEAGTEEKPKHYYVIVPGVEDAMEAFLYICELGTEGLPDQDG